MSVFQRERHLKVGGVGVNKEDGGGGGCRHAWPAAAAVKIEGKQWTNLAFHLKCRFIEQSRHFLMFFRNHSSRTGKADKAQVKGYLSGKHVLANII